MWVHSLAKFFTSNELADVSFPDWHLPFDTSISHLEMLKPSLCNLQVYELALVSGFYSCSFNTFDNPHVDTVVIKKTAPKCHILSFSFVSLFSTGQALTSVSADEQRVAADPYETSLILPMLWTKSFCCSQECLLLQTLASVPNTQL